jgi:hypothetical protein
MGMMHTHGDIAMLVEDSVVTQALQSVVVAAVVVAAVVVADRNWLDSVFSCA